MHLKSNLVKKAGAWTILVILNNVGPKLQQKGKFKTILNCPHSKIIGQDNLGHFLMPFLTLTTVQHSYFTTHAPLLGATSGVHYISQSNFT